jgi:uncharacterized protein
MTTNIASVKLTTEDGETLDADLAMPSAPAAIGVVISHPHPLRGGNRYSPVVGTLFTAFADAGFAVIRYDFRGVGTSTGTHGDGVAERLDVRAAIDTMRNALPDRPILNVGYSFGSRVALTVDAPGVIGWVGVAPPLAVSPPSDERAEIGRDKRPKLLIVPELDQFSPPDKTNDAIAGWNQCEVVVVDQADHFFNHDGNHLKHISNVAVDFGQRLNSR